MCLTVSPGPDILDLLPQTFAAGSTDSIKGLPVLWLQHVKLVAAR